MAGYTHFDGVDAATFKINGTQVTATAAELNKLDNAGAIVATGTQAAHIGDPTGGTTVDTEARTAIASILDAIEAFKIASTS